MKKQVMLSLTAIMAAAAVSSALPLHSEAAEKKGSGIGEVIPVNLQDLKDNLKALESNSFSFPGGNCIIITKPCPPGPGNPNPDNPDTGNPDNPGTDNPDQPGTGNPDNPGTGNPDQPGTDNPDQPEEDNPSQSYTEQVIALVNKEREKENLAPLSIHTEVGSAAQVRAQEIEKSFSHTRPDGSSFTTALKDQGVSYRGAGENIAWGQMSPQQVMDTWMNSDGHRANILNEKFTHIGVGYHQDTAGKNYWTQLFIH